MAQTAGGAVRGISRTTYDAWLGIPYAGPPVGAQRWKPSQPAQRWPGVRDAPKFGNRCVQGSGWDPGYEQTILSEGCLYLNVYVPHMASRGKRPVLVWIHGGGFTGGAGQDTDPRKYAAATGSVFVTINYRLGAMGFLNVPQVRKEGDGAGSFGLLDQQAPLQRRGCAPEGSREDPFRTHPRRVAFERRVSPVEREKLDARRGCTTVAASCPGPVASVCARADRALSAPPPSLARSSPAR